MKKMGELIGGFFEEYTYVFARTPNAGPHSLAMTFERPVTPAFARP